MGGLDPASRRADPDAYWNGAVQGLKSFPPQDRPPVALRVLVVSRDGGDRPADGWRSGWWSLLQRVRGTALRHELLLRAAVAMAPAGFIAVLAGWTTTEVGRQPFTVYGLLRTVDSVSPIGAPGVATLARGVRRRVFHRVRRRVRLLLRLMQRPPSVGETGPEKGVPVRSAGITPAPSLPSMPEHPATLPRTE